MKSNSKLIVLILLSSIAGFVLVRCTDTKKQTEEEILTEAEKKIGFQPRWIPISKEKAVDLMIADYSRTAYAYEVFKNEKDILQLDHSNTKFSFSRELITKFAQSVKPNEYLFFEFGMDSTIDAGKKKYYSFSTQIYGLDANKKNKIAVEGLNYNAHNAEKAKTYKHIFETLRKKDKNNIFSNPYNDGVIFSIKDVLTWLETSGKSDNIYFYPATSTSKILPKERFFTTIIASTDGDLRTKILQNPKILNGLYYGDEGNSCCQ